MMMAIFRRSVDRTRNRQHISSYQLQEIHTPPDEWYRKRQDHHVKNDIRNINRPLKFVQIHAFIVHVVSAEAIPVPAYRCALKYVEEHENDGVERNDDDDGPADLAESCVDVT